MNLKKVFLSVAVPTLIGIFGVALSAWSATTIGTDITTTGTLTAATTAVGTFTASTTAAGSDITLRAMDDMVVSLLDAFTLDAVNLVDIQAGPNTDYGQIFIDPTSDEFQINTKAADASYVTIRSLTTNDGGHARIQTGAQAGDFSYVLLDIRNSGGSTLSSLNVDADSIDLDAGGDADELRVGTNAVTISTTAEFYPPKSATPPMACSAGKSGAIYYDTNLNEPCFCNATDWKKFSDASTTCS